MIKIEMYISSWKMERRNDGMVEKLRDRRPPQTRSPPRSRALSREKEKKNCRELKRWRTVNETRPLSTV